MRRLALLSAVITVAVVQAVASNPVCRADGARNDCGYPLISQSKCEAKGCCWSPVQPNPLNKPWCFYSNAPIDGYRVLSATTSSASPSLLRRGAMVFSLPRVAASPSPPRQPAA